MDQKRKISFWLRIAGIRVPFMIRWPGEVKPGVSDALVSQIDLFASFESLTGQEVDNGAADSFNIIDALLGGQKKAVIILLNNRYIILFL